MPATTTPRILTADDVLASLAALRSRQPVKYWAFYSSQLGGIVTDPALMLLPFDDHMVHRGHGVFDTAAIVDGRIYDLESHLDRFLRSAQTSRLKIPHTRADLRDIIIRTTAASGKRDGSIRYWLSAASG
jgi:4-amino-4-deoxychorismate lyase